MAYGYDMQKAMLAGLLHDCAKCIPNDEKLRLCEENDILISSVERENPFLLHAKLGALLAKTEYDVTDPLILHAIKVHTTGEPDMNILDKIIYIADYIEPNRNKAANLDRVRELAFHDLDVCMAEILPEQIEGNQSSTWILMDYGDIIIHIFSKEDRLFYDLERTWRDGKVVDVSEL